jgi:hypothetical protein
MATIKTTAQIGKNTFEVEGELLPSENSTMLQFSLTKVMHGNNDITEEIFLLGTENKFLAILEQAYQKEKQNIVIETLKNGIRHLEDCIRIVSNVA